MAVVSSTKDSLEILLSDSYKISDSDYKALSDILVSNGVSEFAFDSGLVQIIKIMHETGAKFPMSINFLQFLWKENFISYNFVKNFIPLVSNGLFRLNKVKIGTLRNGKILHNMSLENENQSKFVVVYSTQKFDNLYSEFSRVLSKYKFELKSYINEGVELAPSKVRQMIDKTNKLLNNLKVRINIESYMKDTSLDTEDVNLIIKGLSGDYKVKQSDLVRKAKKYLKKSVSQVDAYIESKDEMFVGLTIPSKDNYKDIPMGIFNFIYELEVGKEEA